MEQASDAIWQRRGEMLRKALRQGLTTQEVFRVCKRTYGWSAMLTRHVLAAEHGIWYDGRLWRKIRRKGAAVASTPRTVSPAPFF